MPEELIFSSYLVYKTHHIMGSSMQSPKELVAKEWLALLDEWEGRIEIRGLYDTTAFSPRASLVIWAIGRDMEDVQAFTRAHESTGFGSGMMMLDLFLGLVRPAEFAKDHLPAFVKGEVPKKYFTVYPFVRTPEWYLLPAEERGQLLKEHGAAGREFPDVLANTTSAFGLGDYEWILAFEADSPDRLVDLIRRLRATGARRYTKLETPFYTGIRKEPEQLLEDIL